MTILLVDHDPAIRRMICRVLTEESYRVACASRAAEAMELVETSEVDLVLLDMNLPDGTAFEAFARLTANHPWLPVIRMTSRPDQLSPRATPGAWMEKPLDLAKLLGTIAELLPTRPKQSDARSA